ncbi:MAG TPA: hypothetical protein VIK14_09290, partial [Ignavibacteria bacterium]
MSKTPSKILILYLLCALFIPIKIFCSTDQKKSIPKNNGNQHEIRIVDSLNYLATKVGDSSVTLFYEYAKKALTLAKSIHYLKGEGEASIIIAQYHVYNFQFSKSLEFCFSALKIANQSNDMNLKMNALKKICLNFVKLKRADKAKSYFQESFKLALNNKDTIGIIELLIH